MAPQNPQQSQSSVWKAELLAFLVDRSIPGHDHAAYLALARELAAHLAPRAISNWTRRDLEQYLVEHLHLVPPLEIGAVSSRLGILTEFIERDASTMPQNQGASRTRVPTLQRIKPPARPDTEVNPSVPTKPITLTRIPTPDTDLYVSPRRMDPPTGQTMRGTRQSDSPTRTLLGDLADGDGSPRTLRGQVQPPTRTRTQASPPPTQHVVQPRTPARHTGVFSRAAVLGHAPAPESRAPASPSRPESGFFRNTPVTPSQSSNAGASQLFRRTATTRRAIQPPSASGTQSSPRESSFFINASACGEYLELVWIGTLAVTSLRDTLREANQRQRISSRRGWLIDARQARSVTPRHVGIFYNWFFTTAGEGATRFAILPPNDQEAQSQLIALCENVGDLRLSIEARCINDDRAARTWLTR